MSATLERVALIAPRYAPAIGGVERHTEMLACGLVQRGVEVEVITTDPTGQLPTEEIRDGMLVRRFPTFRNDAVFYIAPQLGAWLAQNYTRFTLLHVHSYHTPIALQAAMVSQRNRVPFIVTPHYHGTGHSPLRKLLHIPYRPFGQWLMRQAKCVICVSETERTLLLKHFGQWLPTVIAPNGVDVAPLLAAHPFVKSDDRINILVVGRLESYKHIDRLVEAIPYLPSQYHAVIIGDGPARTQLTHLATHLGIQKRVHVLGRVSQSDLLSWYKSADVFVSLSQHEAFGLTLLEAAVGGAVSIVSDIRAHKEVAHYIPPGRISFVANNCTADELSQVILHTPRLKQISNIGNWLLPTWEGMVTQILNCYHTVLNNHTTRYTPSLNDLI